jgi:hypothetical protein
VVNPLFQAKTFWALKGRPEYSRLAAPIPPYPISMSIMFFLKKSRNRVKDVFFGKKDPIFEWERPPRKGKVSKFQIGNLKFKI